MLEILNYRRKSEQQGLEPSQDNSLSNDAKKEGAIPTPDELRRTIASQETTGNFRITALPSDLKIHTTAPEDEGVLFKDYLDEPITRKTEINPLTEKADSLPKATTNKGRVNIIYEELAEKDDSIVARLLGITNNAAERYRKIGSHSGKKGLVERMIQTYTITELLVEHFPDKHFIADRVAVLQATDSRFDLSPWELMCSGQTDRALALVQNTFEFQNREHPDSLGFEDLGLE